MKLTLENVKAACRAAYEAGTLIAQHPHLEYGYERTDNGEDCHCAIGCALDRPTLDKIHEKNWHVLLIDSLVYHGMVEVNEDELLALIAIQNAHDAWWAADAADEQSWKIEACNYFLQLIKE
jgi:hypothetical protein